MQMAIADAKAYSDLIVTTGPKTAWGLAQVEDAVNVCAWVRDHSDYGMMIGAEEYYGRKVGRLYQGSKLIGQVHYNGRIELK